MSCKWVRTHCNENRDYCLCQVKWIAAAVCLMLAVACGEGGPAEQSAASPDSAGNRPVSLSASSEDAESADQIQIDRKITRSVPDRLEVTVQVRYSGRQPVSALGIVENLPPGWAFGQVGGAHPPQIAPTPGQTDRLEFVWITTPPFPFSFTYALERKTNHPEHPESIHGQAVYRRLGGEEHSQETATPIPEGSSAV